jgi:hypothetical protein
MIRKIGRWLLILAIVFVAIFSGIYFYLSESLPDGEEGVQAEELVDNMLSSLNEEGYRKLNSISWTFRDKHHYRWDKKNNVVSTTFDKTSVKLDFMTGDHQVITSSNANQDSLIQVAISYFYNDSFWLVAPFKIRDKGTTRKYVETEDGPGILVNYASGGVTPGDSYLWVLDEIYRPKYWRLWTSNVPIPGMKFQWSNWKQYKGVWLATNHPGPGPLEIEVTNLVIN